MTTFTLNGKNYPLTFSLDAMEQIEDEIGTMDTLNDAMTGKGRVRNIRRVLEILSDGEITQEALSLHMRPAQLPHAMEAIWQAIGEGMRMETQEDADGEETDVVLEEIAKKETGDG